jgi:uncharacterized protein YxjI
MAEIIVQAIGNAIASAVTTQVAVGMDGCRGESTRNISRQTRGGSLEAISPMTDSVISEDLDLRPFVLCLKSRTSVEGDAYDVVDSSGVVQFKFDVEDHRRVLREPSGLKMADFRSKPVSMHKTQLIFSYDGQQVAEVKRKSIIAITHDAEILTCNSQRFTASGDFRGKNYTIRNKAKLDIATVDRDVSMFKVTGDQFYVLRTRAGVDAAFLVAACVSLDDLFADEKLIPVHQ